MAKKEKEQKKEEQPVVFGYGDSVTHGGLSAGRPFSAESEEREEDVGAVEARTEASPGNDGTGGDRSSGGAVHEHPDGSGSERPGLGSDSGSNPSVGSESVRRTEGPRESKESSA